MLEILICLLVVGLPTGLVTVFIGLACKVRVMTKIPVKDQKEISRASCMRSGV